MLNEIRNKSVFSYWLDVLILMKFLNDTVMKLLEGTCGSKKREKKGGENWKSSLYLNVSGNQLNELPKLYE